MIPGIMIATMAVIFAAVFAVIASVAGSVFSQRNMLKRVLTTVAGQLGGNTFALGRRQVAQFVKRGVEFRAQTVLRKGIPILSVQAPWMDASFRMKIFKDTLTPEMKKFIGMEDLLIGSNQFDNRYVIQSNDIEQLQQVLTPESQAEIIKLGRDINLMILHGRVVFETNVYLNLKNTDMVKTIIDRFVDCYFAMSESWSRTDALIDVKVVSSTTATCMVCGEDVNERKVYCESCGTPHHRECWEYLGQCSTYACGHKRFASRPPKSGLFRI